MEYCPGNTPTVSNGVTSLPDYLGGDLPRSVSSGPRSGLRRGFVTNLSPSVRGLDTSTFDDFKVNPCNSKVTCVSFYEDTLTITLDPSCVAQIAYRRVQWTIHSWDEIRTSE